MALSLVVTLTVKRHESAAFHQFEQAAARIMRKHGGIIERVIVECSDRGAPLFKEVHIVTFPSESAFHAYRDDPELLSLRDLRERSIVATELRDISAGIPVRWVEGEGWAEQQ